MWLKYVGERYKFYKLICTSKHMWTNVNNEKRKRVKIYKRTKRKYINKKYMKKNGVEKVKILIHMRSKSLSISKEIGATKNFT